MKFVSPSPLLPLRPEPPPSPDYFLSYSSRWLVDWLQTGAPSFPCINTSIYARINARKRPYCNIRRSQCMRSGATLEHECSYVGNLRLAGALARHALRFFTHTVSIFLPPCARAPTNPVLGYVRADAAQGTGRLLIHMRMHNGPCTLLLAVAPAPATGEIAHRLLAGES